MNKAFHHETQPEMQVEVILASKPTNGAPTLYTVRMRYPRIIHAEVMTHRVFSRNARSSRAVPVKTMIQEVREKPFVPWHWGKNQKGMQAGEDHNEPVYLQTWWDNEDPQGLLSFSREELWRRAADDAADVAQAFAKAEYHKQLANRLLEPFMWIDVLITSTDWANFLWLRNHKDAEPHLQDLARLTEQALMAAEVQQLEPSQWHLPYITEEDHYAASEWALDHNEPGLVFLQKISAARCARISYKPFDGDASYERELERYDNLVKSDRVHASPLEHQATPDNQRPNFAGGEYSGELWAHPDFAGNLGPGWIQFRKTVPNERKIA